jgi:WD40 repeat protein
MSVWAVDHAFSEATTLQGHAGRILDTTFSPDCRYIVSSATDSLIKVWAPDLDVKRRHKKFTHEKGVNALDCHKGKLVTAGGDNVISIWDFRTQELITSLPVKAVNDCCFLPDGKSVVYVCGDTTVMNIYVYSIHNTDFVTI